MVLEDLVLPYNHRTCLSRLPGVHDKVSPIRAVAICWNFIVSFKWIRRDDLLLGVVAGKQVDVVVDLCSVLVGRTEYVADRLEEILLDVGLGLVLDVNFVISKGFCFRSETWLLRELALEVMGLFFLQSLGVALLW